MCLICALHISIFALIYLKLKTFCIIFLQKLAIYIFCAVHLFDMLRLVELSNTLSSPLQICNSIHRNCDAGCHYVIENHDVWTLRLR